MLEYAGICRNMPIQQVSINELIHLFQPYKIIVNWLIFVTFMLFNHHIFTFFINKIELMAMS